MTAVRPFRPRSGFHADQRAGRLFAAYLVSLLLHGLLLFALAGGWPGHAARSDKPPVYYVDLVHKPVLDPQAGRPEPRTPDTPVPAPPEKAPVRAAVPAGPAAAGSTDRRVAAALEKLRDERALQEKFAAMRQAQAVPKETPVGLSDARGTEAGVGTLAYVQAAIQQNWALSPYLLADPRKAAGVEAWVRVTYSRNGRLERFSFEMESKDAQFNESIKRALVKSQQLPQPLPERLEEVRVVFNLKAMKDLAGLR
ncbi:MAG: TonB C-terminal domain-containing protein [Deltaproteobacteria bacterium]|nr:MAG: TonB C-terminal domain-containing protein [Deltaproteobacteria bacterium]